MSRLDEIKTRDAEGPVSQAGTDRRYLLELNAQLVKTLRAAERDLAIFEREMSGIAPEAKSPALPLIRAALAKVDA